MDIPLEPITTAIASDVRPNFLTDSSDDGHLYDYRKYPDVDGVTEKLLGVKQLIKCGWLWKRSNNLSRDWHKRYFVLTENSIIYSDTKFDPYGVGHYRETVDRRIISLLAAIAKPQPESPKRFTVVTPKREYLLEAESPGEANIWIQKIMECSQNAILSQGPQLVPSSSLDFPLIISGSAYLAADIANCLPGNEYCADCRALNPTWVSVNLGITLCISCAGIHRSLSCQTSKIRSLELDRFLPETISLLRVLGNENINGFLEAELPNQEKLRPDDDVNRRKSFIFAKYVERRYSHANKSLLLCPLKLVDKMIFSSPELRLFEVAQTEDVLATAELIFGHGVDVNTINSTTGSTALHVAAAAGQELQIQFLLLNGTDPLIVNKAGETAVEAAINGGNTSYLPLLSAAVSKNGRASPVSSISSTRSTNSPPSSPIPSPDSVSNTGPRQKEKGIYGKIRKLFGRISSI